MRSPWFVTPPFLTAAGQEAAVKFCRTAAGRRSWPGAGSRVPGWAVPAPPRICSGSSSKMMLSAAVRYAASCLHGLLGPSPHLPRREGQQRSLRVLALPEAGPGPRLPRHPRPDGLDGESKTNGVLFGCPAVVSGRRQSATSRYSGPSYSLGYRWRVSLSAPPIAALSRSPIRCLAHDSTVMNTVFPPPCAHGHDEVAADPPEVNRKATVADRADADGCVASAGGATFRPGQALGGEGRRIPRCSRCGCAAPRQLAVRSASPGH